ncbi:D-alanyl-D-alanine carboxypeptidase / D-alanyl-D-alanine-endopeptidase (penicillin-binding protein 4) [Microlunatus soli]|uniref:D-alanyl-D-alanine carboxypeptidase / D-alanyl-D-alanine-endopeptidase (Penicillin-binding protein 4) n=1 Tax=Microlunatus soli TaxID=630515 RepID=A0A1H1SLN9_9ACTN|nr:D-alanyl-D-alanine carboxypeptidase / D-alanyl-D-alanine-endopeptidase (penicillin-binding protein 4) [Microlunatus soli]
MIGAVVVVALAVISAGLLALRHDRRAAGSAQRTAVPSATAAPTATASPTPSAPPAPEPSLSPVLRPESSVEATDAKKLAQRIAGAGKSGGKASAAVMSADSGKLLYSSGADSALIPASTNKMLTAAAALELLGPQHRFSTSVVSSTPLDIATPSASTSSSSAASPSSSRRSTSPSAEASAGASASPSTAKRSGKIILVGGGDPYLTDNAADTTDVGQASLQKLAADTAVRLRKAGIGSVQLGYDASLFTGPSWNPHWPDGYSDVVTPTSALWVDEGRLYGSIGPRQPEPAKSAAEAFAGQLKKQGIKVGTIAQTRPSSKAEAVATVPSLTLERIVERLLMSSDNDAAEVILRQAGIAAGKGGSFTGGTAAVRGTLSKLHAWVSTTHTDDGSGLSRGNRVSADALVKIIRLAASGDRPKLSALLTGLPVAGVEGSLRYRLGSDDAAAGRGLVRAKTGTLREVHSLAGYAYTRDGELLVYAFLVNNAKNEWNAVVWLDKVSAAVATCGCRKS